MSPDRFVIVGGGLPTDHELAAIAAAVRDLATDGERERAATGRPAWQRAMLVEATGGPTSLSPTDLEVVGS